MHINSEKKTPPTKHYSHYPTDDNASPFLAYGFRPIFLILPFYIIISMILWGLILSGMVNIAFMNDVITWHIYEMLFGLLSAGAMAFLTTALPELVPGTTTIIGKKLQNIVWLWIAGRVSFWTIDITGVYLTALLNLAMLLWIIWYAKGIIFDRAQKHSSIAYTLIAIFGTQVWFFGSKLGFIATNYNSILKLAMGLMVVLILLVMRRVNMEAINEILEDKKIDTTYLSRPPLTNLAVFSVLIFTLVEFLYPTNTTLGWLGLSSGCAILAITGDYMLKDKNILNQPYVLYLGSIFVMLSLGYILIGWDLLNNDIYAVHHFRHFITSGGFGLTYLLIMMTVGWVHTGHKIAPNVYTHFMILLIIIATFIRGLIPFFTEYSLWMYLSSTIIWIVPFALYIKMFFRFLSSPRVDGIKG